MEISDIKSRLKILEVLSHYGLKADKNNRVLCPWHNDTKPSLQIYPKTDTFCCFSSNCKAGTGDALQMLENMEGGKSQGIMKAKELLGIVEDVMGDTFRKMCVNLKRSKNALDYLAERKLDPKKLEIGYNGGTYRSQRHCIIFAMRDGNGRIVSTYGRSISGDNKQRHFYLKERKGLYPNYPKAETKKLILTESIIDAATLLQVEEIKNDYSVLALYGTNGLTEEHKKAIEKLKNLEEIILFFDGDEAGKKALVKYAEELKSVCKISKVETPQGEDINGLLQGHENEIFIHLLEERIPFSFSIEKEKQPIKSVLNTKNEDRLIYETKELKIVLLGGINVKQNDRLRVTMMMERKPKKSPLHSIRQSGMDLYNDGFVEKFIRRASEKLEIRTQNVRLVIAELIEELERYRMEKTEGIRNRKPKTRELTEARRKAAIKYLKEPDLLRRTNADIGKTGVVGEEKNRLLMYLIFSARKREKPLHVISLGASGTGKTYLQEKVGELIPKQDRLEITMLSDNAFYYFGKEELKNKLVLIEDLDGAENVLYPLRELMSKKRITKTVTIKDNNGKMKTVSLEVNGPICVAGTTTRERIYEDNANRSILIYRDESKEQKERIMDYQRLLSAGKINRREEENTREKLLDTQLLLRKIRIINPFAQTLKIPNEVFKPLRTNDHYLQFIEAVTFYHQHQRTVKRDANGEKYIETTIEDIKAANYLLKEVLLQKSDELSGACRKFFERLKNHLNKENTSSFYASEIRKSFRINPENLKHYLRTLQKYTLLKIVGGNRYKKGYEYEIIDMKEYENLKGGIKNALDIALEKIAKTEVSG